jgi:hypothetical protein
MSLFLQPRDSCHTNPPTKLRNSAVIHCISKQIKIAVSITDWYHGIKALLVLQGQLSSDTRLAQWRDAPGAG